MAKHAKTLEAIFAKPTRANMRWTAVVGLVNHLGGTVMQRAGSRVAFDLGGITIVLHEPHPGDIMKKYAVEAVRDFLTTARHGPPAEAVPEKDVAETSKEEGA